MARGTEKVTLASIARAVGVSVSTVSNAYNHPDQLTAELRARILETARAVGYAGPDPVARTLRRGRVGALGIIFDDPLSYAFTDPAAALTLQGVAGACERAGSGLVLIPQARGDGGDMIRTALVDGFIALCGMEDDPRNAALAERGIPYVSVDGHPVKGVPWVGIDDRGAARVAAEHVLALGHRRIGIVTLSLQPDGREGPAIPDRTSEAGYYVARQRLAGYRDALEASGVDWAEVPIEERHPNGFAAGERGAGALLDRAQRPTAILAMSDELALGAIAAATARGLTVPGDLSVVGFDDAPPAARANPALTTVHQPHADKGAAAAHLLLDSTRGAPRRTLPTRFTVRASSGPAPGRARRPRPPTRR